MTTQIFKSFNDFLNRADMEENGVSADFAALFPDFEEMNASNIGCWNCSGCSDCSGCTDCSGCSDCSDCSDCAGCFRCSDCSDCSGLRFIPEKLKIPVIENIHQKVLEAVNGNTLDMSQWHGDDRVNAKGEYCGTVHCRAGWVIVIAGKDGIELENKTSTLFAAMQIYKASSTIRVSPTRFYGSNQKALEDIKRCAEAEVELNKKSDDLFD